jgi:Calcineurin-like phosphoesterase
MPKGWRARCSEEDFIRMCRTMAVPEIAKALSLQPSKVYARKRNLQKRLGVSLARVETQNQEYNAIRSIEIKDGTVIVGNDAHYWPDNIPTMHRAMLALCKLLKPAVVIANGDMFDGSSISRFPSIGWEKSPQVQQELEAVQDRMDEIFKASRNAQHYWTAGNHDLRFESRIANTLPQYRGVKGIHLKDHIQGWQPCWAVEINRGTPGWTEVRHREKGGVHAAYRNTVEAGVTVVTGHDHRADVVSYTDRRGRRYGVRTGMMAETPLDGQFVDYLEARRINWQSAIAVLTYRDGNLLYPELCLKAEPGLVEWRGEYLEV